MLMPWIRDEEEMQEMFSSISQYDMANYDVIPLFWADRDAKKVFYLRMPMDETTRVFVGAAMQPALQGSDIQDVLGYMSGNLPGQHPILGLLDDWSTYALQGRNPYDSFLGRNVIDPVKFKAGEGNLDMLKHTWNNLGGSIIKRLKGDRVSFTPDTQLEKFLDLPVVQNIAGRWFKVSNYGARQRVMNDGRVIDAGIKAAQESLMARDIVEAMVNDKPLTQEQTEAAIYSPKINEKVQRYLNATVKRSLGPEMEAYESLQTSEEKEAALEVLSE